MRRGGLGISLLIQAIIVCILAGGALCQEGAGTVRVSGVLVGVELAQNLGHAFSEKIPNCKTVVSVANPAKAVANLLNGEADLVLLPRKPNSEELKAASEKNLNLRATLVGFAGPAIITSLGNQVSELTLEQVRQVFTGEFTRWTEVQGADKPITVIAPIPKFNVAAKMFQKFVLGGKPITSQAVFVRYAAHVIPRCKAAEDYAIGFTPYGQYLASKSRASVKLVALKKTPDSPAVLPSTATLLDGSYAVAKPLYLWWDELGGKDVAKRFAEFCRSQTVEGLRGDAK